MKEEQTSPSIYPLSHGQQAFWLLYKMAPESPAYNLFITARIHSPLEMESFHRAWERVVERHSILRTSYTSQAGVPVQQIHTRRNVNIQIIDASAWSEDYLREQIFAKTERPFNLETDSILRIHLFQKSIQEHILLLTMHHIASDMWSSYVLLNEFQRFYLVEINKLPVEDEESPEDLSYIKFIRWQDELLSSAKGERLWNYWQKQLMGELPILALPTDRPRPLVKTNRGASHFLTLDRQLIQNLKKQALVSGASLYKLLLTAFYVLLYRYTNQEDILVGVPMLGRWGRAFKKSIGYFANSTVIRVAISGDLTFGELLAQVSNRLKEAQKHQDYPFPLLVKQFQSQHDPSRSPLFQVTFALQQERWYKPGYNAERGRNFHLEPYYLKGQRGVTSDLDVVMLEAEELSQVCWQYSTDLFDKTTITRMAGHFQTLLESIVANPNQSIAELPLLTEAERYQLLVEWNNTKTQYPQNKCIHQLFEEQVERTPDAVAVVFEDQHLTYKELNQRANQLAYYLRNLSVTSEVLVGICVERSLEMIVGMLGILKAGGAYVPLDPEYPQERLSFMLSDTELSLLLTQEKLVNKLGDRLRRGFAERKACVICLDTNWDIINQQTKQNPTTSIKADNLAYVMYTSGSTGQPKGVSIVHQGVVRLVKQTNYVSISAQDVIAQASNYAFDAATFEIWGALLHGARLVGVSKDLALSPKDFAAFIRAQGISVLFLTTALFNQIAQEVPSAFNSLRHLLFGGEAVDPKWVKEVLKNGAPQRLLHVYGPTENTTFSSWYLVQDVPENATTIPIGRAIANTQVYILDKNLQPVPVGVPGELHIGGAGLAQGYLHRPETTAEKFIEIELFDQIERVYKTGDLVRYLPDGNIEYIGRIDSQVKIRGFRIELGEIETVVSQYSTVQQAVVVVREEVPGDKRLVAYYVSRPEIFSSRELRAFLKQRLPNYMVAADFVLMEALPLTPNGKVDRRALPAPDRTRSQSENHFVAPCTPTEVSIGKIWTQVLGLKQVGIHDNFFELGGHSLSAVQILSRIRETFEIDLPLSVLFETPTIAALSQAITSAQETQTLDRAKTLPAIVPVPRTVSIPLSFSQYEIWYLEHETAGVCAGNSPLVLQLTGTLSPEVLKQSFNEIIRRHEILRTTFSTVEEQTIQKISPFLTIPLEVIDLQHLPLQTREVEAQKILRQVMSHRFNLTIAPLIKTVLVQLSPEEHCLLILMHHIITDGWSYNVLLEELTTLYDAFLAGKPSPLPDLPFQYADFAIWQRNYFNEEVLATHLPYWQQHLASLPTSLDLLPATETSQDSSGALTYHVALPQDLTNAIASLGQSHGVTPFMVLLTALNILLWKWSDQTDILVLGTMANRPIPDLEKLIGCFISDLPLRTQLDLNQTGSSLLEQVKQMVSATLTHAIPVEKLWEPIWGNPIEVLRTVNLVLVPSMQWSSQTLKYNPQLVTSYREVWNEQFIPLELYVSYPHKKTQAIELFAWYSPKIFTLETIDYFISSYQAILQKLVEHPEQQLFEFNIDVCLIEVMN